MTLLVPSLALAKSWAQVKRDIRERPSANTTVTPDGEWSETTELRNGHEVVIGQFPYIVSSPAEGGPPGARVEQHYSALYLNGRFQQSNVGETFVSGLPPIDVTQLRAQIVDFLGHRPHNQYDIRKLISIEPAEGELPKSRSFQARWVRAIVRYQAITEKQGRPALSTFRAKIVFGLGFANRDGTGAVHIAAPISVTETWDEERAEAISPEQVAAMPSLVEYEYFAAFPARITPPLFNSAAEACKFLYDETRGAQNPDAARLAAYAAMFSPALQAGRRPMPEGGIREYIDNTVPGAHAALVSDFPATFTIVEQSRAEDGQESVIFAGNSPEVRGTCGAVHLRNTYIPNVLLVPPAHP